MLQKIKYLALAVVLLGLGLVSTNTVQAYGGSPYAGLWHLPWVGDNYYGYTSEAYIENYAATDGVYFVNLYNSAGTYLGQFTGNIAAYSTVYVSFAGRIGTNVDASAEIGVMNTGWSAYFSSRVTSRYWTTSTAAEYAGSNAPQSGAVVYAPALFSNYYGWNSSLVVKNLGTVSHTVTVTFSSGAVYQFVISVHGKTTLSIPAYFPAGTVTSAKISIDGESVGVEVNSSATGKDESYAGTPSSAIGAAYLTLPHVPNNYYNTVSSVACVNVAATTTNITINLYTGDVAQTYTATGIAPLGTVVFYIPGIFPNGATTTSSTGRVASLQAACIVSGDDLNSTVDTAWMYNPSDVMGGHPMPSQGAVACCGGNYDVEFPGAEAQWFWNYGELRSGGRTGSGGSSLAMDFAPEIDNGPYCRDLGLHCIVGFLPSVASSTYLQGMNEPNRIEWGDTCARDYKPSWDALKATYSGAGRKFATPGVADVGNQITCNSGTETLGGVTWVDTFMGLYGTGNQAGVDVLNTHCYGSASYCSTVYMPGVLSLAATRGIPEVWLTEFNPTTYGIGDFRSTLSYVARTHQITRFSMFSTHDWVYGGINWPWALFTGADVQTDWGRAYWLYR